MKKLYLSFACAVSLIAGQEASTLEEAFTQGKFNGHIRAFYINRDWQGDLSQSKTNKWAFATAIWLGYETKPFYGASLGIQMVSVNDFGLNPDKEKLNTSILGDNGETFSFVPQAYFKYEKENTLFKAGRQKISTPLLAPDDARLVPTYFEAYTLLNTDLPQTTLIASHVTKIAPGTFFNQYRNPHKHALVLTAGYGANDKASIGKFSNIGWYTVGKETSGVSFIGITNKSIENLSLTLYDYYAHDILNALYFQADYRFDAPYKPYVAFQYINEKDVGEGYINYVEDIDTSNIDANYYGIKAGASIDGVSLYAAYSKTDKNENAALNGSVISPWGGMPAFTQGMVTRHQFLADTKAWKVAGSYKWSDFGVNLKTAFYYASFDVGSANPYSPGHDWTAKEAGFDFIYYPVKNLQLRFRGNFPRSFYEDSAGKDLGWNEFRFIVNYYF